MKNCALAHLLAAERAARPEVNGQAFFLRDFEASVHAQTVAAIEGSGVRTCVFQRLLLSIASSMRSCPINTPMCCVLHLDHPISALRVLPPTAVFTCLVHVRR